MSNANDVSTLCSEISRRVQPFGISVESILNHASDQNSETIRIHRLMHGSEVVITLCFKSIDAQDASSLFDIVCEITDDLWRAVGSKRTITNLSDRLEQAYEQAHLLFKLAWIPENPATCNVRLSDVISRLLDITKLGWVVLQFIDDAPTIQTLRAKQFLAGKPPIDGDIFDEFLCVAAVAPIEHVIHSREQSPLASATGDEVLIQPLNFEGRRIGVLAAGNNGGDDPGLSSFETQLFSACAGYLETFHANLARMAQQEAMFLGTLSAFTAAIDAKDPYTRGHSERVALLARQMANVIGLDGATAERYRVAGLIHDIGKIGVAEAVLTKPSKLTDEEFAEIKRHPQIGYNILRNIPSLEDVMPGVLHHHERFDGKGYPSRVSGESIPLVARVLALADSFDAMSSNRSYRSKLPRHEVLAEIARCAGRQFDPALAQLFIQMDFSEFDAALAREMESQGVTKNLLAA